MLCVKFTLQFCLWYLLSQSWEGRSLCKSLTAYADFNEKLMNIHSCILPLVPKESQIFILSVKSSERKV